MGGGQRRSGPARPRSAGCPASKPRHRPASPGPRRRPRTPPDGRPPPPPPPPPSNRARPAAYRSPTDGADSLWPTHGGHGHGGQSARRANGSGAGAGALGRGLGRRVVLPRRAICSTRAAVRDQSMY